MDRIILIELPMIVCRLNRVKVPKSPEGDYLMEHMINGLYEDLEKRMKQVPGMTASKRSDQIWDLAEEFQVIFMLPLPTIQH